MKAEQTKCPFCPRVLYWSGRNKHIFSPKHLEEHVRPELLKKDKDELMAYRMESKARPCPKFRIVSGNEVKEVHLCFGCKKVKEHLTSDHLHNCPHARQHRAAMKRLVQSADLGDTNVGEDVSNLKSEIENLKRKLKHLIQDDEDAKAQIEIEQESESESEESTEEYTEEEVYLAYDRKRIYVVNCCEENPVLWRMTPNGPIKPHKKEDEQKGFVLTMFAVRRRDWGWESMVDSVDYWVESSTNKVYWYERPNDDENPGYLVCKGHYTEGRLCLEGV